MDWTSLTLFVDFRVIFLASGSLLWKEEYVKSWSDNRVSRKPTSQYDWWLRWWKLSIQFYQNFQQSKNWMGVMVSQSIVKIFPRKLKWKKLLGKFKKNTQATHQISSSNWFAWWSNAPSKGEFVVILIALYSLRARWTYCSWRPQNHCLFGHRSLLSTKSSSSCCRVVSLQQTNFSSSLKCESPVQLVHPRRICWPFQLADYIWRRCACNLWKVSPNQFQVVIPGARNHSNKVLLIDPVKPRV